MNEQQLREQLDAIYQSTSWKITAPLRWIVGLTKDHKRVFFSFKGNLIQLLSKGVSNPILFKIGSKILLPFPALRFRLQSAMREQNSLVADRGNNYDSGGTPVVLSIAAQEIMRELSASIQTVDFHKKKNIHANSH